MRASESFGKSFLDGFTMAGFPGGVARPGEADRLFAEPESTSSLLKELVSRLASANGLQTKHEQLADVSESELQRMIVILQTEEQQRKVAYGTSR